MSCIWYISKYVAPPFKASAGGRGYLIMREIALMGHDCVVITSNSNHLSDSYEMKDQYVFQNVDGIVLCWVRTLNYKTSKSFRRVMSWLHFEWRLFWIPKKNLPVPDVVIVSSLSLLTLLNGFLICRKFNCRLVFEVRDIWPLTLTEEANFNSWNPIVLGLGLIEKLGYLYSDAIVGTMPNLGEHVRNILGRSKETFCIPMGIDEHAIEKANELSLKYITTYIPKNKFIVAHVGSIGITNALDTFFKCAEQMSNDTMIHFLVVGDGDLRLHYQNKYGHLPNLTIAPRVPKTMVQSLLARSDLLYFSVQKSKVWQFGQSLNKVIDYMLAGKPIVASYTGFQSMINEARCGSYTPVDDVESLVHEVKRYVKMPAKDRLDMGARGRAWVFANRRYPKLAQDYLEILLNLNRKRD